MFALIKKSNKATQTVVTRLPLVFLKGMDKLMDDGRKLVEVGGEGGR